MDQSNFHSIGVIPLFDKFVVFLESSGVLAFKHRLQEVHGAGEDEGLKVEVHRGGHQEEFFVLAFVGLDQVGAQILKQIYDDNKRIKLPSHSRSFLSLSTF